MRLTQLTTTLVITAIAGLAPLAVAPAVAASPAPGTAHGGAAALASSPAGAKTITGAAGSGDTWGTAEEVPGTATLNQGDSAQVESVSCASAGNCSAGGFYTDSSGHAHAFVVSQAGGTWGTAEEVPGTATLNTRGLAAIRSVSCASAGNCSAGGRYTDSSGHTQPFVVSQAGGTWRKAEEVPGTGTLNTGGFAVIASVSCASAGNCSAGGYYGDRFGHSQAFVVSQS
jgi:hypothetical protein